MGEGGTALHRWAFATRTFRAMFGQEGGSTGEDDLMARRGFENIGAWVMGRNMFTHERGPWENDDWKGWWGDEPPYHCDVFVLTHHPRQTFEHGGTIFHFVTDGLEKALELAREAARGKDVRLGGGVATIRAALRARSIDELHIAIAPALLGRGEALWHGVDLPNLGYAVKESLATSGATHLVLART
jgi:dihydrofolate reductase